MNPLCFKDYENAPLNDMEYLDEIMLAEETALSIVSLVNNYSKEMIEYCETFEPSATPPKHLQDTEQPSSAKTQGKSSLKEKFINFSLSIGVFGFYAVSFVIAFLPIYAIGFQSFWSRFAAYTAMLVYPPSSVIFWVWGLINTINTFQDGFSIFYYIVFAVFFIPYFLAVIARFFKKQNKY